MVPVEQQLIPKERSLSEIGPMSARGLERRFGLPNAGITGYLSRRVSINGGQFAAASKPAIMPSDILQYTAGIEWLIAVIVLDT